MPRRLLGLFSKSNGPERLAQALEGDQEKPNIEEIIESQDLKLQEVKRNVFSGLSIPVKLIAEPPLLSSDIPAPALVISTHYNDQKQSAIVNNGVFNEVPEDIVQNGALSEADIDFSKAENLFLLEAPIDAKKDHNMLKLAYEVPKGTFVWRLLRRYPMNRKRLAFIQRHSNQAKSIEMVGNVIVSARGGGDLKEITITCQICGQKFHHQHQFQRHILMHPDPENKKFLCQICGKRFNRADHLNRHAVLHGDVKVQKCLLCGEEFDRASHLDRHRRKHHPPAGQQPSQTPPLTPSMKSPPPGMSLTGPFNGFSSDFSAQTVMDQQSSGHNLHLLAAVATPEGQTAPSHQFSHHTLSQLQSQDDSYLNEEEDEPATTLEAPPHHRQQQEQGGPATTNNNTGSSSAQEPDRPYPCEVCGRKFIRATHLRRHMRIHTGEKPFACHICGRRYARGDYLRAHIHAHRRDKIHKCKHCGEVFHDLTRFADHCRLLHKDLDDQFGNPKPPPESSPPPPPLSVLLESSLTAETPEEITIVPSMQLREESPSASSVPITLVTLPNPASSEQDGPGQAPPLTNAYNLSSQQQPSAVSMNYAAYSSSSGGLSQHMNSSDPHLPQVVPATSRLASDTPPLLQNGQIHLSDIPRQDAVGGVYIHRSPSKSSGFHEVFIHDSHAKATPISYIDNVAQYIYATRNHDGTNEGGFPPHSSQLVSHQHPH